MTPAEVNALEKATNIGPVYWNGLGKDRPLRQVTKIERGVRGYVGIHIEEQPYDASDLKAGEFVILVTIPAMIELRTRFGVNL